jgi:hypothetical protein
LSKTVQNISSISDRTSGSRDQPAKFRPAADSLTKQPLPNNAANTVAALDILYKDPNSGFDPKIIKFREGPFAEEKRYHYDYEFADFSNAYEFSYQDDEFGVGRVDDDDFVEGFVDDNDHEPKVPDRILQMFDDDFGDEDEDDDDDGDDDEIKIGGGLRVRTNNVGDGGGGNGGAGNNKGNFGKSGGGYNQINKAFGGGGGGVISNKASNVETFGVNANVINGKPLQPQSGALQKAATKTAQKNGWREEKKKNMLASIISSAVASALTAGGGSPVAGVSSGGGGGVDSTLGGGGGGGVRLDGGGGGGGSCVGVHLPQDSKLTQHLPPDNRNNNRLVLRSAANQKPDDNHVGDISSNQDKDSHHVINEPANQDKDNHHVINEPGNQDKDSHHVINEPANQDKDSHHVINEPANQDKDSHHVINEPTNQDKGSSHVAPAAANHRTDLLEWEKTLQERRQLMLDVCERNKKQMKHSGIAGSRSIVLRELEFVYCPVEKVASTFLR